MDHSLIWSESDLVERATSEYPEVQSWAVSTLLRCYPPLRARYVSEWLRNPSPAVVKPVLLYLLSSPAPQLDLLPALKDVFLTQKPELSVLAIRVAGSWKVAEATEWIQEKILQNQPLSSEQIAAMIETLGVIRSEAAYDLLKATESSMAGKQGSTWMVYYDALLSHRKREDVETILRIYTDPEQTETLRRNAVQLLIQKVDPVLNPSDLLFGNVPRVQEHLVTRLDLLVQSTSTAVAFEAVRQALDELRPYLSVFRPENVSVAWGHLESATGLLREGQEWPFEIIVATRDTRKRCKPNSDESWVLATISLCALLSGLIDRHIPFPGPGAPWKEKLSCVLTDHFLMWIDTDQMEDIISRAPRTELLDELTEALKSSPIRWKTYQAMGMLGLMEAGEGAEAIVDCVRSNSDPTLREVAERSLKKLGHAGTEAVFPLLDSNTPEERSMALRVLSNHPTRAGVESILKRFERLFEDDTSSLLNAIQEMSAGPFLPPVEKEYKAGEWRIAEALVHLCRVHRCSVSVLKEAERQVADHRRFIQQQEAMLTKGFRDWPDKIDLDLKCRQCGKRFSYAVKEIHLHPHRKEEVEGEGFDGLPYQYGAVICNDLRCKNCQALNDLALTPEAFGQITTESLKLLALHRSKISPPPYYPVKQVETANKEGKAMSLVELERENLDSTFRHPTQPQSHLALGKFYEYVKVFPKARRAFLKAMDLDSLAIEAMAGMARLDHAEGKIEDAYEWVERCYRELSSGHFYMTKEPREFKKAVREKRREFARILGRHPEEEPVNLKFQMETTDYPKNRPCPCGSGKKYKLCCMPGSGNDEGR